MKIPTFLYGTAWKEERTEELVYQALKSGFMGIDTANQRKHYFEEAVGNGIQKYLNLVGKQRDDLFIQTKFTYINGQDHRFPYDKNANYSTQVLQSFESSAKHLHTDYLDSYILHGPSTRRGIQTPDWDVWKTMEELYHQGKVRLLGISNVNIQQLEELYTKVKVKPKFVQNRCYAVTGWDLEIRNYCKTKDIIYQGFSLLTANFHELQTEQMKIFCVKYNKTIPQIVFKFSQQVGMLPLTGTTNLRHMKEDLEIDNFNLELDEIDFIQYF